MLRSAEWWNYIKISQEQAVLTVFALDPQGAHVPFAPPGYAGEMKWYSIQEIYAFMCGSRWMVTYM